MAKKKKFSGFTPQQQFLLLGKMGYSGPQNQVEMNKFIQSQPSVASRMGKLAESAQKRLNPERNFAEGGAVVPTATTDEQYQQFFEQTPESVINTKQITEQATSQTPSVVQQPAVEKMEEKPEEVISQTAGQQEAPAVVTPANVTNISTAATPQPIDTTKAGVTTVTPEVQQTVNQMEAATAEPSKMATTRGQLEELMKDFETGTPAWASGAMREAMGTMQRRGLGASSMAGQAVVQAAMESAVGIASRDAATVAQFEMQNLSNRQQTTIFKTQQTIAAMLSDQAAVNAGEQFNAASENQTKQFMANLESTVSRFNSEQVNSIRQFNAGQTNAISQFNSQIKAQRDQFNAQNDLIIAQANAKWRQTISTANMAAQNESNLEYSKQVNQFTQRTLDQIWQRERDIMAFAFTASESAEERKVRLLLADKNIRASQIEGDAQRDAQRSQGIGYLVGRLLFG